MQPLTAEELSLVEDKMSGKFSFPLAKEAKALSNTALSLSHKKAETKRKTMPDASVVDDRPAMNLSTAEASVVPATTPIGTPPTGASKELSPTKSSRRTKSRSSEIKGIVNVSFPADGSAYLDPYFVKDVTNALFLPIDHKRACPVG